jgi:hypothetical protein
MAQVYIESASSARPVDNSIEADWPLLRSRGILKIPGEYDVEFEDWVLLRGYPEKVYITRDFPACLFECRVVSASREVVRYRFEKMLWIAEWDTVPLMNYQLVHSDRWTAVFQDLAEAKKAIYRQILADRDRIERDLATLELKRSRVNHVLTELEKS